MSAFVEEKNEENGKRSVSEVVMTWNEKLYRALSMAGYGLRQGDFETLRENVATSEIELASLIPKMGSLLWEARNMSNPRALRVLLEARKIASQYRAGMNTVETFYDLDGLTSVRPSVLDTVTARNILEEADEGGAIESRLDTLPTQPGQYKVVQGDLVYGIDRYNFVAFSPRSIVSQDDHDNMTHPVVLQDFLERNGIDYKTQTHRVLKDVKVPQPRGFSRGLGYELNGAGSVIVDGKNFIFDGLTSHSTDYEVSLNKGGLKRFAQRHPHLEVLGVDLT